MMKSLRKTTAVLLSLFVILGCAISSAEGGKWFCADCGAANVENFCVHCGAEKPEAIVCPDCGAKYPVSSDAAFCGSCGAALRMQSPFYIRYEGEGFATPEEALTCYMEGFKNLDFDQILSAFAWETQMEHYDLQTYLERFRAYQPSMRPRMPSVHEFVFSANVNILRFNQIDLIYRSLEKYLLGYDSEAAATGIITFRKDSDDVSDFLKKFDSGRIEKLKQMTNIRFLSPDAVTNGRFSAGKNPENFIQQTACYGADEAVNLVGVADVGDDTFLCCPTICRYGDRWYLVSVSSMVSSILGIDTYLQAFICMPSDLVIFLSL